MKLDSFTRQYIETALWSSTLEDGSPMDRDYSIEDLAPETLQKMIEDCSNFWQENVYLISEAYYEDMLADDIGQDFWLTRNHHGSGFWDGEYGEKLGEELTDAAHKFGEVNLYLGDDGKIYQA